LPSRSTIDAPKPMALALDEQAVENVCCEAESRSARLRTSVTAPVG
jgi:hypothetical protein